jgi:hypothetical protein
VVSAWGSVGAHALVSVAGFSIGILVLPALLLLAAAAATTPLAAARCELWHLTGRRKP